MLPLSSAAPLLYTQALQSISTALERSDHLVDIVQASCLLAVHLYSQGRVVEAYRHSFCAMKLAIGLGLHQIRIPSPSLGLFGDMSGSPPPEDPHCIPLPPPVSMIEVGDRISAFWQVFAVDRCWSTVNGLPLALPDSSLPQMKIKTPWPGSVLDDGFVSKSLFLLIISLFIGVTQSLSGSTTVLAAFRAKVVALYECSLRLLPGEYLLCTNQTTYI